jgi:hypothetical protein
MRQFLYGGANWLAVFNEAGEFVGGSGIYEGRRAVDGTSNEIVATIPTWVGVSCPGRGVGTRIAAVAAQIAVSRGEQMHVTMTPDSTGFWIDAMGGYQDGYLSCSFKGTRLRRLAAKAQSLELQRDVPAFPIRIAAAIPAPPRSSLSL